MASTTAGSQSAAWFCAAGLLVVLVLSVVWPEAWCLRICPLGATQDLLSLLARPFRPSDPAHRKRVACCSSGRLGRRLALGVLVGLAWGAVARRVGGQSPRPLRPPGALPEPTFLGLCVRCGNCVRACPARIVFPDLGGPGIASLMSPVLRFRDDYCREDCVRCTEVCPSGALQRVPLADKPRTLLGLARVDMEVCWLSDDRECLACRNYCPYEAITIAFSEESYTLTVRIDNAKCPGCGACEMACPTSPRKAIQVGVRS